MYPRPRANMEILTSTHVPGEEGRSSSIRRHSTTFCFSGATKCRGLLAIHVEQIGLWPGCSNTSTSCQVRQRSWYDELGAGREKLEGTALDRAYYSAVS